VWPPLPLSCGRHISLTSQRGMPAIILGVFFLPRLLNAYAPSIACTIRQGLASVSQVLHSSWPGHDVQIDRRHIPTLPDCIVISLQCCSRLPVVSHVTQQGHHPAQWCVVSSQGQQRETAAAAAWGSHLGLFPMRPDAMSSMAACFGSGGAHDGRFPRKERRSKRPT
jgi:hypothetical protein